jgi:uncharacterized Fe-S cluster-containing MiaB family protein
MEPNLGSRSAANRVLCCRASELLGQRLSALLAVVGDRAQQVQLGIESFNSRIRDECLNISVFCSTADPLRR